MSACSCCGPCHCVLTERQQELLACYGMMPGGGIQVVGFNDFNATHWSRFHG
jgi:hypothetical protein